MKSVKAESNHHQPTDSNEPCDLHPTVKTSFILSSLILQWFLQHTGEDSTWSLTLESVSQ